MFKSTKEFNKAVRIIILAFNQEFSSIDKVQEATMLSDDEFTQALMRAIDIGYISGINYEGDIGGQIMWSVSNPHVTYDGLAFIENSDTP